MNDPEEIRRRVRVRLAEQRELVESLLRLREQVVGSVFSRYGQCGKAGCACQRGERHGPYYVLSRRTAGKGSFDYLDAERLAQARDLVARAREFRRGLRRLQKLNEEVVDLLRRYQSAMARRGVRSLGVPAVAM